jgi:aryl-alcohol dehydrogenase-like predicted oxidoreductase
MGYALDNILKEDVDKQQILSPDQKVSIISTIQKRKRNGDLPRDRLIINTKVGRYESQPSHQFDFSYDTTIMSVQRSIERMNCSYIDVIQLHDPEFAPNISILKEETIPALLECQRRGWAKAIGLTGYPIEIQHQILVECQGSLVGDAVVFDQSLVYCHNNLHDMSLYRDRCFPSVDENGSGSDNISFAQFCLKFNIHLMAAAPLSMGLLTLHGPPSWHPASIALKEACSAAVKICESKGVNISSLALLFALSQPEVGCTLLGMKNVDEVDAATDLAMRFCGVNFDTTMKSGDSDSQLRYGTILDKILTKTEREVLSLLLDEDHGPFSGVISNGEYRWNWKDEVTRFWSSVQESGQTI